MKKLMILGTFHMASQADIKNFSGTNRIPEFDGELDKIAERLASYKPTKIFVEWEKAYQHELDDMYRTFLEKGAQSNGEITQIAFRLGKKTGADKIYAIDWMDAGVATHGCDEVITRMAEDPALKAEIDSYESPDIVLKDSITEVLRLLNSTEEVEKSKAYYTNYARVGVDEYYGMGWLIWWYQRNLNIFANISNELSDGDRAFLLIGGAHKGILEGFFKDSKSVEIVDSLKYLD